jgi:replicative superfamily II helicase
MGWGMLKSVLEHMVDRLKAGAKADLLELAQIPYVKSRTARVFWENGMKSVRTVAEADPKDLVAILLMVRGTIVGRYRLALIGP